MSLSRGSQPGTNDRVSRGLQPGTSGSIGNGSQPEEPTDISGSSMDQSHLALDFDKADVGGSKTFTYLTDQAEISEQQSIENIAAGDANSKNNKIGPPCTCKGKCFTKVGETGIKAIFEKYYETADEKLQTTYIQKMVTRQPTKTKVTKKDVHSRNFSSTYTVEFHQNKYIVCKQAFLSIHGIKRRRLDVAMQGTFQGDKITHYADRNLDILSQGENVQETIDEHEANSIVSQSMDFFISESATSTEQSYEATDASCANSIGLQSVESSALGAETPLYTKKIRIRTSKPETWACNVRKRLRNSGQSYKTKKNERCPE